MTTQHGNNSTSRRVYNTFYPVGSRTQVIDSEPIIDLNRVDVQRPNYTGISIRIHRRPRKGMVLYSVRLRVSLTRAHPSAMLLSGKGS